ncbi:EPIDERMAL PATTERNING FACTOR-like protein 6 [Dendrobium catenatum]|uniref:Epidermal patterning factor-like protein n=1 Tax=Dendrobium catenatum TaxID=906689 RepID=A0A2I0WFQ8_9ASPA|nr:EPIDERMAL PATTERNING FACTOR-like protein 6 [Dendrobium catenatum]
MNAVLFCVSLCFFSASPLFSINCNEEACKADRESLSLRTVSFSQVNIQREEADGVAEELPGSDPPRCTNKCGECTPCRPVHVPVPPGTTVTTEYYPEAWLCKCGEKFFIP